MKKDLSRNSNKLIKQSLKEKSQAQILMNSSQKKLNSARLQNKNSQNEISKNIKPNKFLEKKFPQLTIQTTCPKEAKNTNKFEILCDLTLQNNLNSIEERNSNHFPLDLLILLILNQSTTDTLSDRAFEQLKKDYPSAGQTGNKQVDYKKILQENNPAKLVKSIQICGLASTKAKYILNALQYLSERGWLDLEMSFVNQMSDDEALKAITAIKGVAIKSASCLLMFGFGRNTFPIDTHLFRIFKRVGRILPLKIDSDRAHKLIQPLVNDIDAFTIHVGLIELGRKICISRKPLCGQCYLNTICDYALEQD